MSKGRLSPTFSSALPVLRTLLRSILLADANTGASSAL